MTKRQQQAAETKEKLLQAAEKLILEKDFNSVSINEITAECGLAAGTFYLYFKSKDELLVHLSKRVHSELEAAFSELPDCPALDKMRFIIAKWFQIVAEQDYRIKLQTYRIYTEMLIKNEKPAEANKADYEFGLIKACLDEAVKNGELIPETPVEFLSMLISVSMHGSTVYSSSNDTDFNLLKWSKNFSEYVFGQMLSPYIV